MTLFTTLSIVYYVVLIDLSYLYVQKYLIVNE